MGRGEEQLLEAVKLQDIPVVQKLIQRGKGKILGSSKKINVNYQDKDDFTALHQAAVLGNAKLVCLLLDANASIDLQDKNGLRPLHYCAWKGKVELVSTFLGSGASCNLPAHNGSAPLHLAAQYGHAQVCKILLEYGADISTRQSDGCSPMDLACEFGRIEVAELFLRGNDSMALLDQLQTHDGAASCSPLHLAARNGHTGIIRLLLQSGADINWRTSSGTCLHEAVSNQKPEIVQLLIDCGIDVSVRSGLGQTAIELAHKLSKSPAIAEILRKLSEAQPKILQVYATNDYQNILDQNSLAFTKGTLITVLERNPNGNWKGKIEGSNGEPPTIGIFPSSFVQPCRPGPSPGPSYRTMAGSDDSGIHPHDEDAFHLWNASNWARAAGKSHLHPTHNYINLDPRSSQPQPPVKVPLLNSNVVNPSYEDVICSQPDQPVTKESASRQQFDAKEEVTRDRSPAKSRAKPDPSIARKLAWSNQTVPRREPGISRSRPSISNPGYEDILTSTASGDALTYTSVNKPLATVSGRPKQISKNVSNRTSERAKMQVLSAGTTYGRHNGYAYSDHYQTIMKDSALRDPIHHWLASFGMEQYVTNFAQHGYDFPTAVRASLSDLAAIRVLDPSHRKLIADRGAMLKQNPAARLPFTEQLPRSVDEFLRSLFLEQYVSAFARSHIESVEQLLQTTWENLQEMGINKLGHQKKLMLAIINVKQIMRRGNSSPTVRSKSSVEKPSARQKSQASFHETPGLSSELQKALSRRQKIIDDAETAAPSSQPQSSSISTQPQGSSSSTQPHFVSLRSQPHTVASCHNEQNFPPGYDVTNQRRPSNSRGPPPSPPKRVSSMVIDDNFTSTTMDPTQSQGPSYNAGNHVSTARVAGGLSAGSSSPAADNKPPIMPKAKPIVMKKPKKISRSQFDGDQQPVIGGQHFLLPTTAEKISTTASPRGEIGARFDLSALDRIKNGSASFPPHSDHETGDDFEWPAPPTMQNLPQSIPPPFACFQVQPQTMPVTNPCPSPITEPPASFRVRSPDAMISHNKADKTPCLDFFANENTETTKQQCSGKAKGNFSAPNENTAPPLPAKLGKSRQSISEPTIRDTSDVLSHEDTGATQQMLDDITSMFDGLAQEFDDFLA